MNRDDIQKLLGGYATGTLTPEEEQELFRAALDDQELFDALGREQSLRDLLRDPAAKMQLLDVLDTRPSGWLTWWRPAAAVAAMAAIAMVAMIWMRTPPPVQMAIATRPPAEGGGLTSTPFITVQPQTPQRVEADLRSTLDQREAMTARLKKAEAEALPMPKEVAPARSQAAASGGGAVGVIGGVPSSAVLPPVAQPETFPAPPPPAPPSPAKPVAESVVVSGTLADAAASPRARDLFLGARIQQPAQAVTNFVEQQQKIVQSPAPAQQETDVQKARQQTAFLKSVAAPATVSFPGVRYAILRGSVEGRQDEVNLEDVKAGDSVSLRLETNTPGYLYTWVRRDAGQWRPLVSFNVEPMKPYTSPTLQPGENEVYVWFSRTLQMAMSAPTPPALGSQSNTNALERAGAVAYVVNPVPVPPTLQVRFTIRLP